MSSREKRLLAGLFIIAFLILNLFLYTFYVEKKAELDGKLVKAKSQLQTAISYSESSDALSEQMDWFSQNQPATSAYQDIQNALQQFAVAEARRLGLTINSEELLPTDESGVHYHRAQFTIKMTGKEELLYQWFDLIHDPLKFRTAYQIRIKPNKDDTLVDCEATLSQWFIPTL